MARKSASPDDSENTGGSSAADKKTTPRPAKAKAKAPAKAKSPAKAKAKSAPRKATATAGTGGVPSGRSLVIVESPKKAKSINKFLGSGYVVKASMGHVRDLPDRKLGLDVLNSYAPTYEIMKGKKETISELQARSRQGRHGLSRDRPRPRRRGDRLASARGARNCPTSASAASRSTRSPNAPSRMRSSTSARSIWIMVNAQQARRFLDRFVGYQLSPLLWKKIARHLSAGRVQSVAVRLIADREKEIRAFVSEEYWKITATVSPAGATAEADRFATALAEWQGAKFEAKNEADAHAVRDALAAAAFTVSSVEESEKLDKADAPFKTSTLQQQGAIRLRFSGKRTMKIAQELYEGIDVDGTGAVGLITYMRTDSLRVSDEALTSVREHDRARVRRPKYLPAKPHRYAAGKSAQEAHEAIRPTDLSLHPDKIKGRLTHRSVQAVQPDLSTLRRQPDDAGRLRGDERSK